MSDLIDRAEAINAINAGKTLEEAFRNVTALPSAQPEITRCRDCKWWSKTPLTISRRCSIFDRDTEMTFFCKHGQREM